MKPIFKTIKQLLGYLLVGLPFLVVISPTLLLWGRPWVYDLWITFDIKVCELCHGVTGRTISDYTGERMFKYPRYKYQAKVIDFIFKHIEKKPFHCLRAFIWFLSKDKKNNIVLLKETVKLHRKLLNDLGK